MAMKSEIVKIKGRKEGLAFYFNTENASWEDVFVALDKKLQDGAAILADGNFLIAEEQTIPSAILVEIKQRLSNFGMHEVVPLKPTTVKAAPAVRPEDKPLPVFENPPMAGIEPQRFSAKEGDSVMITRSLRSGQSVHINGNAVIMGDVNAGAHVMATGSVIVMGALKGIAHAGIGGDRQAFVLAWHLEPIQIRIADFLSRNGDEEAIPTDYPEQAAIEGGRIVIKPYSNSLRLKNRKLIVS